MTNATLCTTNNAEPWAANVEFNIDGINWSATLKKKYTHYRNLLVNYNVAIVYKDMGTEIIAKAHADLTDTDNSDESVVNFKIYWIRVVKNNAVKDIADEPEILRALESNTLC